ncbi:MAG: hypothetical protein JSV90_05475 [Methanobacteriota archaeon]|nr:MAG: hypothetical protein JSV90_05475 [Euryarchaeota archaeon]
MKLFKYNLHGDPEKKFQEIQSLAKTKGVILIGDSTSARFYGVFEGSYSRIGTAVTVTVTSKPSIVSWQVIDSMLRDFIESS